MTSLYKDLSDISNYQPHFEYEKHIEYANRYINLINLFLYHIKKHVLIQNQSYFIFVIERGLETISHIFMFLFMYTKNT